MKILNKIIFVLVCSLSGTAIFASESAREDLVPQVEIEEVAGVMLKGYESDEETRKQIARRIAHQFAGKKHVPSLDVLNAIEAQQTAIERMKCQNGTAEQKKFFALSKRIQKMLATVRDELPNSGGIVAGWHENFKTKIRQKNIPALQAIADFLENFIKNNKSEQNHNAAASASAQNNRPYA